MHYRWFDEDERRDELGMPKIRTGDQNNSPPQKKPRYFSRAMITGMLLSIVILCYGISKRDMPIIFLALAFVSGSSRSLVNLLPGKLGQHLSNLLFGFSIALFFGAIIMAFT